MAYPKQTWLDGSVDHPVTDDRMNHIEDGIEAAAEVADDALAGLGGKADSGHNHAGTYATPADVATASTADRARANHTGTQTVATLSDFTEAVQDTVAGMLAQGTNVTLTYDDNANTLTVDASGSGGLDAEAVRDAIGVAILGIGLITVTVNDEADTITISTTATQNSTDAQLRDRTTHTGAQPIASVTDLQDELDARALLVNHNGDPGRTIHVADTMPAGVVDGDLVFLPGGSLVVETETGTTYTVIDPDDGKVKRFTHASLVTVTLPAGKPIGFHVELDAAGAAGLAIVDDGTSVVQPEGAIEQYQAVSCLVVAADTWSAVGPVT